MTNPSLLQRQQGANLLEFALVLPVFLLLLFGMIEFGLVLVKKNEMTSAVREGARYGIILTNPKPTDTTIKGKVCDALGISATSTNRTTCTSQITVTGQGGAYGTPLTVAMTAPYTSLFYGQLFSAIGRSINVTATSTMVNE